MERIIIVIIALIILALLLFIYFYINIKQNKLENEMAKLEEEHIYNEIESSDNELIKTHDDFKQNMADIYETEDYSKDKSTLDNDLENTNKLSKVEEINIDSKNVLKEQKENEKEENIIEIKEDIIEKETPLNNNSEIIIDNKEEPVIFKEENNKKQNIIIEDDVIETLSFEPIKRKIEKEVNDELIKENIIEEKNDEYELVNIQVNKKNYIFQTNEKLNKKDKIKLLLLGKVQFGTVTKANYKKKKDLVKTKPQKLKIIERK